MKCEERERAESEALDARVPRRCSTSKKTSSPPPRARQWAFCVVDMAVQSSLLVSHFVSVLPAACCLSLTLGMERLSAERHKSLGHKGLTDINGCRVGTSGTSFFFSFFSFLFLSSTPQGACLPPSLYHPKGLYKRTTGPLNKPEGFPPWV